MSRSNKKTQIIGLDIPHGYLEYLEELLFKNGIFKENGAAYINGQDEPIEYDIENIEHARFLMEYSDVLSIGKSTSPVKIFRMFKVVFDYFQATKSPYRSYLVKDPSLIDDTLVLSKDLVEKSLLLSALNTVDISINDGITDAYIAAGYERLKASGRFPMWSLYALNLIDRVSREMLSLIEEHSNSLSFKNGKHYRLQLYKNMVIAEEMEDIRIVRYENIISRSTEAIKSKTQNEDILDEHLDILLSIRNEEDKYKKIKLERLAYMTEKLEEFEFKLVDRTVVHSLNIEVPLEEEE